MLISTEFSDTSEIRYCSPRDPDLHLVEKTVREVVARGEDDYLVGELGVELVTDQPLCLLSILDVGVSTTTGRGRDHFVDDLLRA